MMTKSPCIIKDFIIFILLWNQLSCQHVYRKLRARIGSLKIMEIFYSMLILITDELDAGVMLVRMEICFVYGITYCQDLWLWFHLSKNILTRLQNRWSLTYMWMFVLHMCHSFILRAVVRSPSTGSCLLDVIYHLNLQYLLITDITADTWGRGGGSGDSGCWLVSHLHDIETL
jgi:hypothetical protein